MSPRALVVPALAFVAVLAGAASAYAGSAREPVAVAPWRNLNEAAALRWLEQGAAETITADLRKAGVAVVERAQIAEALAQVAAGDDVARAVAAGRLVGARSLVLGSFQASGAELRLVARIVDVETGVVGETAKATGPSANVFALQDRIVALLVKRAGRRAPRPRPPPSAAAYERFSLSLTAADDDARRALLDDALRLDPGLVYARDALAALEARLRDAARVAAPAFDAREAELLRLVEDKDAPTERRRQAAALLLEEAERARRFRALLGASERVLAAALPPDVLVDVNERASAARVLALARLVRVDAALQAGERHLVAFPAGAGRAAVEKLVRDLVEERRSLPDRRREYDDELAALSREVDEAAHGGAVDDDRRVDFAWKPCIAAKWSRLPDEMLANCARFLAAWPRSEHVAAARAYIAWAHALKGDHRTARALASRLEAELPGALDETGLRALIQDRWSSD